MSLHGEFGRVIFGQDVLTVIQYLCNHGLLSSQKNCNKCGSPMRIGGMENKQDKTIFCCTEKHCKTTMGRRGGSFLEKSKLPLDKWLHVIYLWSMSTPVTSACTQVGISRVTGVDIYNFLREVCSTALLRQPVLLGGPGRIVQIDESLFCHKCKHHRGHPPVAETWVFGMVDCSTSPATGFVQIVKRRNTATLLPIIHQHIRPSTMAYFDEWRAYNLAPV